MRCSLAEHVADVVAATVAALMLAITVLGFAAGCDSSPGDRATNEVQVARLRAHFAAVDAELRAADISHLSPAQREARSAALERLRAYAARGVFPHNHLRAELTPVFVDEHDTRCAMAHLIEEADGAELMAAIAQTRNLAYVPELADDATLRPELVAWLDRNGLTAAEAARIQPAYNGCEFQDCTNDVDPTAMIGSLALAAANGAVIAANLRDDAGNRAAAFGLLVGGTSMFTGYFMLKTTELNQNGERELQRDIAWIDVGLGAASALLSLRTLTRDRPPASVAPAAPVGPGGWSVAPIVGETRGVSLSARF